ncbi:MAG: OmpA family protein [Bacteroidota bacterium]
MWYRVLLLMLPMMVVGNIQAQLPVQTFRVNFKVNEFSLDQQDNSILLQVVSTYKASPYSEITIAAHTDNDADQNYNINLSKNRALSVRDFLIKNGIQPTRIMMSYHGENKPLLDNCNVNNKSKNRRVDIEVENHSFSNVKQMLKAAGGNYKQSFKINPTQPNTIKGKNGTTVFIPANVLVDENNRAVNKEVTVHLSEFLNTKDALFNSLSTQTNDGKILETGGMFSINAYANNKALKIKKGNALKVVMPSNNMKPDMEIFNGVVNSAGVTEWKATGKPFVPGGVIKIKQYDLSNVRYYFKVPPPPMPPSAPTAPHLIIPQNEEKYFNVWDKLLLSKAKRSEKYALYVANTQISNSRLIEQHKTVYLKYKAKQAKYVNDLANYQMAYNNSFNNWVDEQIQLQLMFLQYIRSNYKDSLALNNLIKVGADYKVLNQQQIKTLEEMMHNGRYKHLSEAQVAVLNCLEKMKSIGLVESYKRYGWRDYVSSVDFHDNNYGRRTLKAAPALSQIAIAEFNSFEQVAQSKNSGNLNQELASLEQELTYTAYIESMGVVNCDRFSKTPPDQFVQINLPDLDEAQVAFYIPSQKSFIYAGKSQNGYYVRIPKNTDYTLFVMSLDKNQPMFFTQRGKAETTQSIQANLQPTTIAQLRQSFDGL